MRADERKWMNEIAAADESTLLERWRTAIGTIGDEMVAIRLRQRIFAELDDELVRRDRGQPSSLVVYRFLRPVYVEAQLVALRRLTVDDDVRSHSLTVLLDELLLRPAVLSRRSYLDASAGQPTNVELTDRDLDHVFGDGNDHLAVDDLKRFRIEIAAAYQQVQTYVNRHVAHAGRDRVATITWGNIDQALDDLEEHVNRLHVPLTGAHLGGDLALRSDWRDAFRGLFDDKEAPDAR